MIVDEADYIQHFGVKGMRWGIRKTPAEVRASRALKAQKYVREAAKYQDRANKAAASNGPLAKEQVLRNINKRNKALENANAKYQGDLTERQKKIAIGAGTTTATLAAIGTAHSLNTGNARRLVNNGKRFITRDDSEVPFKPKPELSDAMTEDQIMAEVVAPINPDYGGFGTKMNCRRATYAYEMRRRGYDVAATRTYNGVGQEPTGQYNALNPGVNLVPPGASGLLVRQIAEKRKGEQPFTDYVKDIDAKSKTFGEHFVDLDNIPGSISKQVPSGARGEFAMQWQGGGGHSMSWEKIGNKVVIFDNQTGKKYSGSREMGDLGDQLMFAGFTRLDDKPLNMDFLQRWVKDA